MLNFMISLPWRKGITGIALVFAMAMPATDAASFETDLEASARLPKFSHRELSESELRELVRLGDVLIDRDASVSSRRLAVQNLGQVIRHMYAIPTLLAVARDQSDDSHTRVKSVVALSFIADRRNVDFLIDALSDDDTSIAMIAWQQLVKITGQRIPIDFKASPEGRQEQIAAWRNWWESNREDAVLLWLAAEVTGHPF